MWYVYYQGLFKIGNPHQVGKPKILPRLAGAPLAWVWMNPSIQGEGCSNPLIFQERPFTLIYAIEELPILPMTN